MYKFRTWSSSLNDYQFSGGCGSSLEQFIGILDKNSKQIFVGDVVKAKVSNNDYTGEVVFKKDFCAYFIGDHGIYNLDTSNFEVIGSMQKDYNYDELGNLVKFSTI